MFYFNVRSIENTNSSHCKSGETELFVGLLDKKRTEVRCSKILEVTTPRNEAMESEKDVTVAVPERDGRPPLLPYSSVVHGENARHPDDADAFFAFKIACTYRRTSCLCFWVTNLCWIILTLALGFSGLNPINTDNIGEVGLVIPDSVYQQRENAYEAAMDEANMALNPGKCPREDVGDPIEFTVMKGRLAKENRGNALSKKGLDTLRRRENQVLDEDGWEFRCARVYDVPFPTCTVNNGSTVETPYGPFAAATEKGCLKPFSPVYFFERYGDPDFDDIPGTVAKIQASSETDWRSFTNMLHKDFTTSNMRSKILKSQVYAGTPRKETKEYVSQEQYERILDGFSISFYNNKETEEEFDHLSHWIKENLVDDFVKDARKTPYRTLFSFPDYDPVSDQVIMDLTLLIISIIAVILYMWIYTCSLYITFCGMFQIFASFFGANLLYRYCWPTPNGLGYDYFTLFCALALFIIMGIGADDVFVYWDTWNGSVLRNQV